MDSTAGFDQRFTTVSDGEQIAWRDYGSGERTAVLVHGLAANGDQFHADALAIAATGVRVIVPDVRGHGRSKVSNPRKTDFSLARMASDMREVLDAVCADPVDWVGNSLGGIIALEITRHEPERLRSLTLFGTAFRLSLPAAVESALPLIFAFPGPRITSKITAFTTTADPEGRKIVEGMIASFDPVVGAAVSASVRSYDLRLAAAAFPGRLTVIRGGKDRAVNMALDRDLVDFDAPTFRLVDMPVGGHCANLDDPEFFRSTLAATWAVDGLNDPLTI